MINDFFNKKESKENRVSGQTWCEEEVAGPCRCEVEVEDVDCPVRPPEVEAIAADPLGPPPDPPTAAESRPMASASSSAVKETKNYRIRRIHIIPGLFF